MGNYSRIVNKKDQNDGTDQNDQGKRSESDQC